MADTGLSSHIEIDFDTFSSGDKNHSAISQYLKRHSHQPYTYRKNIVSHGLLAFDELSVIYGAPGSTKSAFAIDTACRTAVGMDWDGEYTAPISGVLYIAAERIAQVRRRADAFSRHHQIDHLENLVFYDGPIDLVQDRGLLAATILSSANVSPTGIDLVIIDTLAAAMSASDSSPDAMAAVVATLSRTQRVLRDAWGEAPHVAVVHHTPASGEARLRGGGQLLGAADVTLHISTKRGVAAANVEKNNDSPDRPSFSYALQSVTIHQDADGTTVTAPVVVPEAVDREKKTAPNVSRAHRDALAGLRAAIAANDNRPVTEDQWRASVYEAAGDIGAGGKRMRFRRHLEIVEAGLAIHEGGLFHLT